MQNIARRRLLLGRETTRAALREESTILTGLIFERRCVTRNLVHVRAHLALIARIAQGAPGIVAHTAGWIRNVTLRVSLARQTALSVGMLHLVPILHLFLTLRLIKHHDLIDKVLDLNALDLFGRQVLAMVSINAVNHARHFCVEGLSE